MLIHWNQTVKQYILINYSTQYHLELVLTFYFIWKYFSSLSLFLHLFFYSSHFSLSLPLFLSCSCSLALIFSLSLILSFKTTFYFTFRAHKYIGIFFMIQVEISFISFFIFFLSFPRYKNYQNNLPNQLIQLLSKSVLLISTTLLEGYLWIYFRLCLFFFPNITLVLASWSTISSLPIPVFFLLSICQEPPDLPYDFTLLIWQIKFLQWPHGSEVLHPLCCLGSPLPDHDWSDCT